MVPDTIASEPIHGWRLKSNHSKVALEWLHWMDHCLRESLDRQGVEAVGIRIQHAGRASTASPIAATLSMGTTCRPTQCTNSKAASGTGAPNAFLTALNPTVVWKTVVPKTCIDVPKRNFNSWGIKVQCRWDLGMSVASFEKRERGREWVCGQSRVYRPIGARWCLLWWAHQCCKTVPPDRCWQWWENEVLWLHIVVPLD